MSVFNAAHVTEESHGLETSLIKMVKDAKLLSVFLEEKIRRLLQLYAPKHLEKKM